MADFRHGTDTGYNYHKCRCEECVAYKKASSRAYYLRNREQVQAQVKRYRQENHERILERERQTRATLTSEQRQKKNAYWTQYQKDNPTEVNTKNRAWRKANPWKAWFYGWRRRERSRGQEYDDETLDWIKGLGGSLCTYCKSMAEGIDHMLPRSKGGTNHRENLTPCCHRCNRRKGSMTMQDFISRLREEP